MKFSLKSAYNAVFFKTNVTPFDAFFFKAAMWNTARQTFTFNYKIFCLDVECPLAYYFDYTNQICLSCSYTCTSCINNYCSICELGTLINGRCSLNPGCANFIQNNDNSQICLACD